MITFKKLRQVKQLITQLAVSQIIPDANPKAMKQVDFTGNLEQDGNTTMFEEVVKETTFWFFHKEP